MKALRGHRSAERGAAAVEFALVVPVLVLLLFGIIDFGLWFEDSIALRQGVREGARQGIVENFGSGACRAGTNVDKLICTVKKDTGSATGTTYVKVTVFDAAGNPGTGWEQGGTLRVCALTVDTSATGFVPLPNAGVIRSQVDMRIEQDLDASATGGAGGVDGPGSLDWSWCSDTL